ncbi:MAG: ABC transporter ATP-binding protein [Bacillota bacterium]|nr:ABC transporter ATP-binding protein [Bacillota bacterium]
MNILSANKVKKTYTTFTGAVKVEALRNIDFEVRTGEFVAIMGESGAGKTTLLNILALLDRPTSGEILIEGRSTLKMSDKEIARFRRDQLGFVFQDFNLIDTFQIRENIYLPLVLAGVPKAEMDRRIVPIAESLGITALLEKYPYEISGGEKQRVAVARAVITQPKLLLADEPTGALDSRTAKELLAIFRKLNGEGQTIVMVTHSTFAASHAERVLFIRDGEIFHQIFRGDDSNENFNRRISDSLTALSSEVSR